MRKIGPPPEQGRGSLRQRGQTLKRNCSSASRGKGKREVWRKDVMQDENHQRGKNPLFNWKKKPKK